MTWLKAQKPLSSFACRTAEVKRLPVEHLRHVCEWGTGTVVPEGAVPRVWLLCSVGYMYQNDDARDLLRLPGLASAGRRGGISRPWDCSLQDR